jgi:photosystem II stability/assembly factor-like uncharacterized protein
MFCKGVMMTKKILVTTFMITVGGFLVSGCSKSTTGPTTTTEETPKWTLVSSNPYSGAPVERFASSGENLFVYGQGGAFYSKDNGLSWTAASIPSSGGILVLAANGATVFAGCDAGIFRSTDNGISWHSINQTFSPGSFAFAPTGNTVFASTQSEVIYSSDNGNTWTAFNTGLPDSIMLDRTFYFNGYYYISCPYSDTGLYRTPGNQTAWQRVEGFPAGTNNYINELDGYGGYMFAGTDMGILRSADNGNSWKVTTLTQVFDMVIYGSAIFASTMRTGILYSIDDGVSWRQAGDGLIGGSLAVHNGYLFTTIGGYQIWRLEILGYNKTAV